MSITVVVLGGDTSPAAGPTMHALRECVEQVADAVQVAVAVTDRDAARRYRAAAGHLDCEIWEVGEAEADWLGRAEGALVATLCGGDLPGASWLRRSAQALADGARAIARPELCLTFDGGRAVTPMTAPDARYFLPESLYFRDPGGVAAFVAPRAAVAEAGYLLAPATAARECWRFTLETLAAGWRHVPVPDTLVAKRAALGDRGAGPELAPPSPALRLDRLKRL